MEWWRFVVSGNWVKPTVKCVAEPQFVTVTNKWVFSAWNNALIPGGNYFHPDSPVDFHPALPGQHPDGITFQKHPRQQSSWGQHGAQLGPVGPRWAPCWPHEPCYTMTSYLTYWSNFTCPAMVDAGWNSTQHHCLKGECVIRLCSWQVETGKQGLWEQHGAYLGPTWPRWAPCWPHEPCYL